VALLSGFLLYLTCFSVSQMICIFGVGSASALSFLFSVYIALHCSGVVHGRWHLTASEWAFTGALGLITGYYIDNLRQPCGLDLKANRDRIPFKKKYGFHIFTTLHFPTQNFSNTTPRTSSTSPASPLPVIRASESPASRKNSAARTMSASPSWS
jgi:hypothetical protein